MIGEEKSYDIIEDSTSLILEWYGHFTQEDPHMYVFELYRNVPTIQVQDDYTSVGVTVA